jgi:hypothetical protein
MRIDSLHVSLKGRLVHGLLNDAISSSNYIASNDRMVKLHLIGKPEENHEKPQSGEPVSLERCKAVYPLVPTSQTTHYISITSKLR